MIKIGIDPSGTGTTGIVIYEDNKLKEKFEFTSMLWLKHVSFIKDILCKCKYCNFLSIINIENCLPTNANGSKDRDDLLRVLGAIEAIEIKKKHYTIINWVSNWVSPKYTKSVVKNMENLSKYNDSCLWKYDKDPNLTYQYGKGWFYNNEKISNHLRDAIIIANYER
ncbi:hypothetical protein M0C40_09235 [Spiroplasma citri]|uniref:Uncharacterized protein n=1 Tax=Spiroplasma citri TaxID=2133 RepID=A0AAX3SY38_SPICI|nr:hypothetical protein [Spiroplasma citri]WFG96245.1 hypothetical protein M0C40_09235 [Spiroplasma citri]